MGDDEEDEQPADCEGCLEEHPLERYDINSRHPVWLCELCSSTFLGNMVSFPQQHEPAEFRLAQIMTQLAWRVLEDIRKHDGVDSR